jgi:multicomponent Na+:H+ antiporter subunit G
MSDLISDILLLAGTLLLLLAAIGMIRMPDLYTRMQSASKASTLGIACVLLALAFHFPGVSVNARVLVAIFFFFLTTPVTAHLIGRASYFVGVPLWKGTVINELRGHYNPINHNLNCHDDPEYYTPAGPALIQRLAAEDQDTSMISDQR